MGAHSKVCWGSSNHKKHPEAHRLMPGWDFLAMGASQAHHISSAQRIQEHKPLPAGACINCSSFSLDGNTCLPFGDSQERATAPHTQQNEILVLEICSRELPKARLWENLCPGLIWACPSIPAQGLLQLCEKGGAQREQGVLCCQIHPSAEQDQVSSPSGEGYPCLSVPRQNYQAPG